MYVNNTYKLNINSLKNNNIHESVKKYNNNVDMIIIIGVYVCAFSYTYNRDIYVSVVHSNQYMHQII